MKLDEEQIYHLIDLLEMNIKETKVGKSLLDSEQKLEAVVYDENIIKVLNDELKSRDLKSS